MAHNKTIKQLAKWQENGLLSDEQVKRITEFETPVQKDGSFSRLIMMLGSFSLVLGFMAIIGANWNSIPSFVKLTAHAVISIGLAASFYVHREKKGPVLDTLLILIFGTNLSFIALIGQVFQLQGHPFFAILIWMAVSTPLIIIYGSSRFIAYAWIIGLAVKNVLLSQWLAGSNLLSPTQVALVSTLVSSIYLMLSHLRAVDNRFPLFTQPLRKLGTFGIVLGASLMQIFWRTNVDEGVYNKFWSYGTSVIALIISYILIIILSAQKKTVWQLRPSVWFFMVSIAGLLAPVAFVHPSIPFIGAVCFIAYWVAIGYAAYLADEKKYLDLVIWVITIRLFIVYIELFGTLATTGLGLIGGGIVFLGLGWGARKMQKYLGGTHAKA